MEKLSLEKFKDFEIENTNKNKFFGGGTETQESCATGGPLHRDEQTDTYNDSGDWVACHVLFANGVRFEEFDDR